MKRQGNLFPFLKVSDKNGNGPLPTYNSKIKFETIIDMSLQGRGRLIPQDKNAMSVEVYIRGIPSGILLHISSTKFCNST